MGKKIVVDQGSFANYTGRAVTASIQDDDHTADDVEDACSYLAANILNDHLETQLLLDQKSLSAVSDLYYLPVMTGDYFDIPGPNAVWTPVSETRYEVEEAPGPPTCLRCEIELCEHLDAYYGQDPYEKALCSKCRRNP
jgi:hypothetical protein